MPGILLNSGSSSKEQRSRPADTVERVYCFFLTRRYAAEIESGELKIDNESKEAAWVPLSSAVELPLAESQRRRLKDVMEYQKQRRTFLR